jgi:cytoskeletal protein CcmA (bactofilin family)
MSTFARNDKVANPNANETAHSTNTSPAAAHATKSTQSISHPLSNTAVSGAPGVSVISKALKITGQLESTEDIRIDGQVDGDVRAVSVTVGSGAKVKGTVYGNSVELSGTIEGKIEAGKVVLTSSAHMSGDIIHQDIKIESGAFIDGHCRPEFGKSEVKAAHTAAAPMGQTTRTKQGDADI